MKGRGAQLQPRNVYSKHEIQFDSGEVQSYEGGATSAESSGAQTNLPDFDPVDPVNASESTSSRGKESTPADPMRLYDEPSDMRGTQVPHQEGSEVGENWNHGTSEELSTQQGPSSPLATAQMRGDESLTLSPSGRHTATSYPCAIKLLVSNNVAGSIIGRAGQTISDLQSQTSARIKLSQTGDCYPGTQDRVCLVQGQLDNVKQAAGLLIERLYMLQGQQHSQQTTWQAASAEPSEKSFDFVVRLLVPSSSCGMIIGKAGASIKQMEGASGVSSIRLSSKEDSDPSTPSTGAAGGTAERILTLTGPTMKSCLTCFYMVLDRMIAHNDVSRYSNMTTSYSRVSGPSGFPAVPSSVIPPVARTPDRQVVTVPGLEAPVWEGGNSYQSFSASAKRSMSSPDLAGQMIWDQRMGPLRVHADSAVPSMVRPLQPREPTSPYSTGFPESAQPFSHEMPPVLPSPARLSPSHSSTQPMFVLAPPSQMGHVPLSNSVSAPDLLAFHLQDSLRIQANSLPGAVEYAHGTPQIPQPTSQGFTAQVHVPDTLIGSILGRSGRTLNELQMHSNTRIRISQRGEFVPGTRNRIVTIRGPTAHSVSLAQYLMSQRLVLPATATFSHQASIHHPTLLHEQHTSHTRAGLYPPPQAALFHESHFTAQYQGNPNDSSYPLTDAHTEEYPSSALSVVQRDTPQNEHQQHA